MLPLQWVVPASTGDVFVPVPHWELCRECGLGRPHQPARAVTWGWGERGVSSEVVGGLGNTTWRPGSGTAPLVPSPGLCQQQGMGTKPHGEGSEGVQPHLRWGLVPTSIFASFWRPPKVLFLLR